MFVCVHITMLYTRDEYNTVNQLYFNQNKVLAFIYTLKKTNTHFVIKTFRRIQSEQTCAAGPPWQVTNMLLFYLPLFPPNLLLLGLLVAYFFPSGKTEMH